LLARTDTQTDVLFGGPGVFVVVVVVGDDDDGGGDFVGLFGKV
jgi:hypothetical protein